MSRSTTRTAKIPLTMPSPTLCRACVDELRIALADLAGVESVRLHPSGGALTVTFDPAVLSEGSLFAEAGLLESRIVSERGHVVFKLSGMDCPDCARTVDKSVSYLDGVLSADLVFATGIMVVEYEPGSDPTDDIVSTVRRMGYGIELMREGAAAGVAEFRVRGLDCPDCAEKLRARMGVLAGVDEARVDFGAARLRIEYDPEAVSIDALAEAVRAAGYDVETAGAEGAAEGRSWWSENRQELTTGIGMVLLVTGWVFARLGAEYLSIAAFASAIIVAGTVTARRAVASLRARSLDMNALMTIAVVGAVAIGEWSEAATVVVLFAIGNLLEARSLAKTRASIRGLMDLTPPRARVLRQGAEAEMSPEDVRVGEVVVVRPGERIPLDGEVVAGSSVVDESPITGESVPAEKSPGARVYAGTLNASGLLEVKVSAAAEDSTLSRVIYMVEEAQAQKAPSQRLIDRFTRYYTPTVVALAVAVAIVPPVLGAIAGFPAPFAEWFRRGLVVLVVSCPCALVISTPVAVVSAITRATREGVLVKGGLFLETAPSVKAVALDKTGTITHGTPEVTDVIAEEGYRQDEVLRLAAALEAGSTHPLAGAVVRAAGDAGGDLRELEEFTDTAGKGVSAVLAGSRHTIGSRSFAEEHGALLGKELSRRADDLEDAGKTVLVLSREGRAIGLLAVADSIRPESAEVVRKLLASGIEHVVMLTGDNERTASGVAERVGVTAFRARLLPEDKVSAVREMRETYGPVVMVGDGVNDAPALALSDIGVAMGAKGSDTALETADVALMREGLAALPGFLELGRATVSNIRQNVFVSIAVKVAVLIAAIFGLATLWMAVFADTGMSLLVTLNGLRLLRSEGRRADGATEATGRS